MGLLATYLLDSANRSRAQDYATQQYGEGSQQAQFAAAFPSEFAAQEAQAMGKMREGDAIAKFYGAGQQPQQAQPQGVPQDADNALQQMGQSQQAAPDQGALQRYQAMAYLPSGMQAQAQQQMMFEGQGMGGSGTGITDINQLPPTIAPTVKAVLEGRQPPPSGMAMKTPYWQMIMQSANQIDPNFDQTTWKQRSQAVSDLAPGGKDRVKINNSEALLNHLAELQTSNKNLGGTWMLNGLWNTLNSPFNPALKDYETNQKTAGDEYANVLAGVNGSTQAGRDEGEGLFTANQSPTLRQTAIMKAAQLAMDKVEPIASSYNSALGKAQRPIELMSPKAQKSYAQLFGADANTLAGSQGQYTPEQRQTIAIQKVAAPSSLAHLSDDQLLAIAKQKGLVK